MAEHSTSTPDDRLSESEFWNKSRAGARAGRGFHYQHLVSTLILVQQWAGLAPTGYLVPEGIEDSVVELTGRRVWIQIKSRKDGEFREAEVRGILDAVDAKARKLPEGPDIRSAVVLEQPCSGMEDTDFDQIFSDQDGRVFICKEPRTEIVRLLLSKRDVAETIAEGLVSDLYRLVADASAENASVSFRDRRRISTTEVDRRIFEWLEAVDPTAIDLALRSGALEPVDLTTPVNEPDFYRGVKVKPGHVAANLVLDRPNDVREVLDTLRRRRHVLVSGPSGAGKSALVWLTAATAAGQTRWYRITGRASAEDAEAIVRFVRARRSSETSPLGVVFDEIGSANSDLWDLLVRDLRGLPELYLLGSIRQEDVNLIVNQSDTAIISIALDEALAQSVWEKLSATHVTGWTHWREPFEQSEGLMLEYVHLLTQGQRLAEVIGDQIRLREHEGRVDELAIVRGAAVLCDLGGEVDAGRLFELLDLGPDAASLALKRLIDEHLVRESRPGVLGGLHKLRSQALVDASHDGTVFQATDTLWKSLPATTGETLPRVVQSMLANAEAHEESESLRKLADILGKSSDIDKWSAILTGLGLATLDQHVASFLSILDEHGVQPAHRSLAAAFADPVLDVPELTESDQLERLRGAIFAFRASPKHDLRAACMQHFPPGTAPPGCQNINQTNRLLSCLAPICGGDPVCVALPQDLPAVDQDPDIRQIARLLSTAFLVDPATADNLVEALGGERALLDLFHAQIPWTTPPTIEADGRHGRTVRSNWHQVADGLQPDPHESVCDICETLIALSPRSDAAACDAVGPTGETIAIDDYTPWSKNIPRKNLPPKARMAWNVAFRQLLLARTTADSLTDYTSRMAILVRRTEKVFRSFSEKWIKGKRISSANALASEIKNILEAVNALSYATSERTRSTMTEPNHAGDDDTLGSVLTGILGNLVGRLSKLDTAKAAAVFAGFLHAQAREHRESEIWRTTSSPPEGPLSRLSERLNDVSCILHELAHDSRPDARRRIVETTKKVGTGNAVRSAARFCRLRAERRFESRLRALENALAERDWKAHCLSRPIGEPDSPYWPAREVAVVIEIEGIDTQWLPNVEELLLLGGKHFDNDWPFRMVPVMNGKILTPLAWLPTSKMPVPDEKFARDWAEFVDRPMFFPILLERFDGAAGACMQISAIVNSRGVQDLHSDEDEILSTAVETFNSSREAIEAAANGPETDHLLLALDYLDRLRKRLNDEVDTVNAGRTVEEPICMTPHQAVAQQASEDMVDYLMVRLLLLQEECNR